MQDAANVGTQGGVAVNIYKVGQVWERDGLRREIVGESNGSQKIVWRRPPDGAIKTTWCQTWLDWASKATLVGEGKQ